MAQFDPPAIAEDILAGKMRERDLGEDVPRPALFSVENYVTQVGQGPLTVPVLMSLRSSQVKSCLSPSLRALG